MKLHIIVKQGMNEEANILATLTDDVKLTDMEKILEVENWLNEHTHKRFHITLING